MKSKVLAAMKPKVASLGFTIEELEGAAATVAGNLQDDATDEQINSAIDVAIPLLKLSQSAVNRIVNASKEKEKAKPVEKKDDKPEEKKDEEAENVPAWAKSLIEKVDTLSKEKLTDVRLTRFEEVVNGLPNKQKASMISDFKRISFENNEDFESYLKEKQDLIPEMVQEQANLGLGQTTIPGGGGDTKTQAEAFAKKMAEINKKEQ